MKNLILMGAIALLLGSCHKDQRTVSKLDGYWEMTGYTTYLSGEVTVVTDFWGKTIAWEFDDCKLSDVSDSSGCDFTWISSTSGDANIIDNLEYRVTGSTSEESAIELIDPDNLTEMRSFKIISLDKDELIVEDITLGVTTHLEFERQ